MPCKEELDHRSIYCAESVYRSSCPPDPKYSNTITTQLIFTTHESTLMDQDLLRRDEIWLMEKSKGGESSLQRMDEKFSLRFDKELERNYLKGLFGSVPDFGSERAIQRLQAILNIKKGPDSPKGTRPMSI